MKKINRLISPYSESFFLLGPRGTGKSTWLKDCYRDATVVDLLKPDVFRTLQNPTIKQMLDNPLLPVDVEYIFSSIQGDFAVGRSTLYTDNYLLYADVTNSDFLKTFEDLRPMLALTGGQIVLDNVGTDEYVMRTYEGNYYFGVKNNRLYVTNNRSFAEEAGRTYGASMGVKPWSAEVKQNRLYASVNLSAIAKAYRSYSFTGNKQVDTFLMLLINQCNYLNASMPDWRQGKAELVLNDKDQNLLKLLVSTHCGTD